MGFWEVFKKMLDLFLVLLGGYITLLVTSVDKHFDARFELWKILFDYYQGLYSRIEYCIKRLDDEGVTVSSLIINYSDDTINSFLHRYEPVLERNRIYTCIKLFRYHDEILERSKRLDKSIKELNQLLILYKYTNDIDLNDLENIKNLLNESLKDICKLLYIYKKFLFK